jgi:hypothetical protein
MLPNLAVYTARLKHWAASICKIWHFFGLFCLTLPAAGRNFTQKPHSLQKNLHFLGMAVFV